jgi:choline dehydrogenase-like flavoprotein
LSEDAAKLPPRDGTEQEGAVFQDMNVVDGVRQTVADAYLRPVLGLPNLTVATSATVTLDVPVSRAGRGSRR